MARVDRFGRFASMEGCNSSGARVYELTESGKLARDYRMWDQIRRAMISISNNIAEGFEYNNNKIFIKYLMYAKGSAGKARSLFYILKEASMLGEAKFMSLKEAFEGLSKSIEGFHKYLKSTMVKQTNLKIL